MQLPFGGVAMVPSLAGWFFVIDYGGTFVIDWLGHKHALTAAAAALGRPLGSNALSMVAIGRRVSTDGCADSANTFTTGAVHPYS